jgi:uncharacterized protein (TIGR02646 family)
MIPLTRIRTAKAIHPNFRGEKRVALNLSLLKKKIAGELEGPTSGVWDNTVWKEAKAQLLKESAGKCAYCESPTSVVSFGDVEHFRPKSKYWWLAYCYENYLPACIMCNQKFKQDYFELHPQSSPWPGPLIKPAMSESQLITLAKNMTVDPLRDTAGMPLKKFLETIRKERALILNPYFQNPEEYFAYKPILRNKEVLIVAHKATHKAIVEACNRIFGINRQELRDERFRHYATYMTYRYTLHASGLPAKLKRSVARRIADMTGGALRYTGMIRYFETKPLEDLPWDFGI